MESAAATISPNADEATELRHRALVLDHRAEQLAEQAKDTRAEAAKLRAQAERIECPETAVKVTVRARDRVRDDGLLAAAAVAVEDLKPGFEATDLAVALGIADRARAGRLVRALHDLGKVTRQGEGWAVVDPDEGRVRDFVVEAGTFTMADAMAALPDLSELDVSYYLRNLSDRGALAAAGGGFTYVEPDGRTGSRPRRRPPEQDPPAYTDVPRRGTPVRLEDHGQRGKAGAQPGQRHRMKLRDQRRQAMDDARAKRAEKQRAKSKGK
jgi:hypothetical protein